MARKTPQLVDSIYSYYDEYEGKVTISFDIRKHPEDWIKHVELLKSLRVTITTRSGDKLSYSCYRGKPRGKYRTSKNPLGFWYARKRIRGKQRNLYLGKDEHMSFKNLEAMARKINVWARIAYP